MIAYFLQEQDPLQLNFYKDRTLFSFEEIKRHDNYILNGTHDASWIYLNIFLDKNNPLYQDSHLYFNGTCDISNPVNCDINLDTVFLF